MTRLKFLLDANVGTTVGSFLKAEGHNVASVTDLDPRMTDQKILELAHREDQILVTCDKDFGDLIFNKNLPHKGVVRLEDTSPKHQVAYLKSILSKHVADLMMSVVVAQGGMIRIRKTKSS